MIICNLTICVPLGLGGCSMIAGVLKIPAGSPRTPSHHVGPPELRPVPTKKLCFPHYLQSVAWRNCGLTTLKLLNSVHKYFPVTWALWKSVLDLTVNTHARKCCFLGCHSGAHENGKTSGLRHWELWEICVKLLYKFLSPSSCSSKCEGKAFPQIRMTRVPFRSHFYRS